MPRKPIELPPEVAKAFVKDMRVFFDAGGTGPKADEIAARQLHALRAYQGPREKKLKLTDIKRMFVEMKDHGLQKICLRTSEGCRSMRLGRRESRFGEQPMEDNSIEAMRELCDDLDGLIEVARQGRAPIRALSLIERARTDLERYLDEIYAAASAVAWSGLG